MILSHKELLTTHTVWRTSVYCIIAEIQYSDIITMYNVVTLQNRVLCSTQWSVLLYYCKLRCSQTVA